MRILITGASGMLGTDLLRGLEREHRVLGLDYGECDITVEETVRALLLAERPELVIHAAAYTNVEAAETDRERAFSVNVHGSATVARGCRLVGARMVMVSTDFVFDGAKGAPYLESDRPEPVNAYGLSKLEGEQAARAELGDSLTVVRTSWLYGAAGDNFLSRILRASLGRERLGVVDDEFGSPTWTVDLTGALARMIERGVAGPLFHLAGGGCCSRFELAGELFSLLGVDHCRLERVSIRDFRSPVRRPANSALASERLAAAGIAPLRHWREALAEYVDSHLRRWWREVAPPGNLPG